MINSGIFSLILALGVTRFAYTSLLTLMQQQSDLGLAKASWLAADSQVVNLNEALIASRISSPGPLQCTPSCECTPCIHAIKSMWPESLAPGSSGLA